MSGEKAPEPIPLGDEPVELDAHQHRLVDRMRDYVFKPGVAGLTVDEISSGMGVSKKTLYRFFPTRRAILRSIVNLHFREIKQHLETEVLRQIPVVDKIHAMMRYLLNRIGSLSVPFAMQVRRLEPELYQEIMDRRWQLMTHYFGEVILQGQQCGVFRSNLNAAVLTRILITGIHEMVQPQVLQELDVGFDQMLRTIFDIFMNGVALDDRVKKIP